MAEVALIMSVQVLPSSDDVAHCQLATLTLPSGSFSVAVTASPTQAPATASSARERVAALPSSNSGAALAARPSTAWLATAWACLPVPSPSS